MLTWTKMFFRCTALKFCQENKLKLFFQYLNTISIQIDLVQSTVRCLNSEYLLFGTCRQKSTVALTEIFLTARSCILVRFISTADKFVANGWRTGQLLPTTSTLNWFTRNAKHGFNSCKLSNLAGNTTNTPCYVLHFCILSLCGLQLPLSLTSEKWQNVSDSISFEKF